MKIVAVVRLLRSCGSKIIQKLAKRKKRTFRLPQRSPVHDESILQHDSQCEFIAKPVVYTFFYDRWKAIRIHHRSELASLEEFESSESFSRNFSDELSPLDACEFAVSRRFVGLSSSSSDYRLLLITSSALLVTYEYERPAAIALIPQ